MDFENLTPEQQEKAKAAQTPDELEALAAEEGQKLADEQLGEVSGGLSADGLTTFERLAYQMSGRCIDLGL